MKILLLFAIGEKRIKCAPPPPPPWFFAAVTFDQRTTASDFFRSMLITQVAQLCLVVLLAAAMPCWSHLSNEVKQHCAWVGDRLETSGAAVCHN